jgi:2-C-methyl-D-erythritol 4-phosphate cytidylyltransferase
MTWVVVPAAGKGLRAGGEVPKQYAMLAGKPMLQWTLERLLAHPRIAGAVVVLAADDRHWPGWTTLAGKPILTAVGGADRAASVRSGLAGIPPSGGDWVLVHDAARPCVGSADLDALLEHGCAHDVGALLAIPVADTLKRSNDRDESLTCIPRENTWRALTPQLFRRVDLIDALDRADRDGAIITDEASAFERLGRHPLLVRGSASNLKVTTRDDFALAEWFLIRTS